MPPIPQAKYTPLSDEALALLSQPIDLHNHAQHEARMNQWLMGLEQSSNERKIQNYVNAWRDWSANAAQYIALNMPVPAPPAPPVLEDVGPMPVGYWFGIGNATPKA